MLGRFRYLGQLEKRGFFSHENENVSLYWKVLNETHEYGWVVRGYNFGPIDFSVICLSLKYSAFTREISKL